MTDLQFGILTLFAEAQQRGREFACQFGMHRIGRGWSGRVHATAEAASAARKRDRRTRALKIKEKRTVWSPGSLPPTQSSLSRRRT